MKESATLRNSRQQHGSPAAYGGRRLGFSVKSIGHESVQITIKVSDAAFTGASGISIQDAAPIAYEKIVELLAKEDTLEPKELCLTEAVELGVQLIDTADAYGPGVSEELIAEALSPYDGLLIATKGGYERSGPSSLSESGELTGWTPNGRPDHLRSACEASLRRLRLDRIDLYQLHTPDPAVPFAESIGALKELQDEGKIRHIGVSSVTLEQLAVAQAVAEISTVQNRLDFSNSRWRDMLNECETHGFGFIPYRPLRAWDDAAHRQVLAPAAARLSASTDEIALAWLLAVSPVTLPIPGTATRAHLEDNLAAAALRLDHDEIQAITAAVSEP